MCIGFQKQKPKFEIDLFTDLVWTGKSAELIEYLKLIKFDLQ